MNCIEEWLHSRIGLNFRSGLSRMKKAVELLGFPEESYPIIHVTGTNGKGSTIAFMRDLFQAHSRKVGTFTSPHMISIHDRICIDSLPISDQDFIRLGKEIQQMEDRLVESHDCLSFFEILTLIALLYFREERVDLALIEVGIGGLLDTTNVLTGELALITSIGFDHQETLGNSLKAIAEQKAGIFKAEKIALIGPLPRKAQAICQEKARQLKIPLYEYGKDFRLEGRVFSNQDLELSDLSIGLEGDYQKENAALALESFLLFVKQKKWGIDTSAIREALARTRWAGRLEAVSSSIYLDGAHNVPALERLVDFVKHQKHRQISLLFAALKRKDYQEMLDYLQKELPNVDLMITSFDYDGALEIGDRGDLPYIADYRLFIEEFEQKSGEESLLFVTGSLYFISEVRAWYMKWKGK